jgi:hypothetical protein
MYNTTYLPKIRVIGGILVASSEYIGVLVDDYRIRLLCSKFVMGVSLGTYHSFRNDGTDSAPSIET